MVLKFVDAEQHWALQNSGSRYFSGVTRFGNHKQQTINQAVCGLWFVVYGSQIRRRRNNIRLFKTPAADISQALQGSATTNNKP
jgi:hypothetical protein